MIPVIVLAVLFVMLTLAGRLGVPFVWGWWTSRSALAGIAVEQTNSGRISEKRVRHYVQRLEENCL